MHKDHKGYNLVPLLIKYSTSLGPTKYRKCFFSLYIHRKHNYSYYSYLPLSPATMSFQNLGNHRGPVFFLKGPFFSATAVASTFASLLVLASDP